VLVDNGPVQPLGLSADARRDGDDDAVTGRPWIDRWVDTEPSPLAARWADIAVVERPPIIERKAERSVKVANRRHLCMPAIRKNDLALCPAR
jgi:hypothetical protein